VAKRPITGGHDARPRVYMRMDNASIFQAAAHDGPAAEWYDVTSMHDAIDHVAGEGACERPAVIFWLGSVA
jgi:hypothetical protein